GLSREFVCLRALRFGAPRPAGDLPAARGQWALRLPLHGAAGAAADTLALGATRAARLGFGAAARPRGAGAALLAATVPAAPRRGLAEAE
ncbi:unnamed protein product, partial [Effrenium voratum]